MLHWTLRSLITQRLYLLVSVSAVAGAFALVLFFEAVFAGESKQIVEYIQRSDADVWVMQRGVSNMHMATSFVSDWKVNAVAEIEGVSGVTPILYLNTVMRAGDRNWFSFIVGLEENDKRAGPWSVADGKRLPSPGEVIVPSVLGRLSGLAMGDDVEIAGRKFSVAGFSEGTFSMANSITFVTMADLAEVMSTIGSMSYFLVDAEPGVDGSALAARIQSEVEKVNALPAESFIEYDHDVAMQMGLEIIGLMTIIGGGLAVLLTGFAIYTHTVRKERELAVMKALGVRNRAIYASVMVQAVWIASLGFALATVLVFMAGPLTATFVPQVTLQVTPDALLRVGVAAIIVALISSIIPVRRLVRLDPMTAFRN